MTWQKTPYTVPLILAAGASTALALLLLWGRRREARAQTGMLLMFCSALWMLGSALELASVDLPAKVLWWNVQYLGICIIPPAWLVYTLQCTGRASHVTRRNLALLSIVPLVTFVLLLTNDGHGLIFRQVWLDTSGRFVVRQVTYGPGFWIFVTYSYATLAAGVFLLVQALVRAGRLYRWQGISLVIAVLAPWLINALADIRDWGPFAEIDLTPFALGLTIPIIGWSLFRLRRLDLAPVARDTVLEALEDAVVVLDAEDRIVDLNPAARGLLGPREIDILGQRIEDAWPEWLRGGTWDSGREMTLGKDEEQHTFDVSVSPLVDWRGNVVSRAIVLRDVTELKHQTLELSNLLQEQILLRKVGEVITAALDLETVLSRIAEQMGQAVDATSAYICRYDPETQGSTVLAEYISSQACARERVSDLGTSYTEVDEEFLELMHAGHYDLAHIDDPDLHESDRAHMEEFGAMTILYIPLRVQERVIGFAELWESRRRREFSPGEIALCGDIARQAAVALDNARVYALAQQEISERKHTETKLEAALREKEVLLKEIHHRVKNNLQVISSLLNLQAELVTDRQTLEMIAESRDRIRVMALVHEQLYQAPDLTRVNLVEYVESLANRLFRSYGTNAAVIRLEIDVEHMVLGITAAVPCGLLINELLSNALKHAFPGSRPGSIYVGLATKEGWITLVVSDNGIGFPAGLDFRNTQSLGMQLVTILVEQLGGAIELERRAISRLGGGGGTTFRITFAEA